MATLIERATEVAQAQRARFVLASALPREASGREAMIGFEQQVARAVWRHGLDGGVCRLEGLYGSHAEESERHALLGPFVAAGIAATPAQIAAPLDALHWPLHVRDAVDGIVAMLHRGGPNCVRFAGAIPYRTRDLLATVEAVLGVPMTLETDFLDERRGTHPPQIGDARRLLRWRPRVGLFAGVEEQAFSEVTRVDR
jgi:nucleoside-diphosphate-sugar epimerase